MSGDGGDELPFEIPKDDVTDYLAEYTLEGRWEKVIEIYYTISEAHTAMISDSVGTALHVAVDLDEEKVVKELVNAIITQELNEQGPQQSAKKKALEMENEHGDTPLHLAASRGFAKLCKFIIGANNERVYLMSLRNKKGETPLFQAAINWQKHAFAFLSHNSRDIVTLADLVRNDGDSILHCAIRREYFDLAVIIVHYYDFLSTHTNKKEFTPLKVLATRPSAFRSGSNLSWWKQVLYHSILVEPLAVERTMKSTLRKMEQPRSDKTNFPKNYTTLYDFFSKLFSFLSDFEQLDLEVIGEDNIIGVTDVGIMGSGMEQHDTENPPNNEQIKCTNIGACQLVSEKYQVGFFPPNYATLLQFVRSAYVHTLGLSGVELKDVKKTKKRHRWSGQLLKALMERPYAAFTGSGGRPTDLVVEPDMFNVYWKTLNQDGPSRLEWLEEPVTDSKTGTPSRNDKKKETESDDEENDPKETAFLVAAKNGITEMVNVILSRIPSAIHNMNSKKENVLLVAVKNRQPLVVETLRMRVNEKPEVWNNLVLAVDDDENTMLHLAAQALAEDKPWQIAGSALQMMWDIKWFQYIRSLVPQHFNFRTNKSSKGAKTAAQIFKESHTNLINESAEWLKDTSESCSVVAGLVAGVSFATASSVPGGTSGETGKPILEGRPAFDVFAISSLIGLCFSVTGLIMFLSILTTRKEAKDFRRDLPLKLLLGLSSLFVSIAAMFVSFCTGHFFVLNGKYKRFLFPIYAATCLPVTFYAVAQFPLYYDLLSGILTKVPRASDKGDSL